MEGKRQPTPRVELYVRSLRPDGYCQQQAELLDRIDGLVSRGVVAERRVHVCGCQVPATRTETTTAAGERLLTRLSEFRTWADRNDRTLTPAVEVREVTDSLTDSHYRAVRLPACLLAEFRGDELCCVTPHRAGGTTLTVPDRIRQLEAGEPTEFEPLPGTAAVAVSRMDRRGAAGDEPDDEADAELLRSPGR